MSALFHALIFAIVLAVLGPYQSYAFTASPTAIKLDGSLKPLQNGVPVVSTDGKTYNIGAEYGVIQGTNLFHSFQQFDLGTGNIANFSGPTTIGNIISRVTGGTASSIDGILQSSIPGANLYFLNPAGVIFGPNASLDIGGSFHVSTADYLKLGTDGRFDATTPSNSILTTAAPSAFGFATAKPSPIILTGSLVAVPEGKSVTVAGGDITMANGNIYAPSGTIDVLSVASPGEANITQHGLTKDGFNKFGVILITDGRASEPMDARNLPIANIDASGKGGGKVRISGDSLTMKDAYIFNDTYGDISGGATEINMAGKIDLIGSSITGNGRSGSASGASLSLSAADIILRDNSVTGLTSYVSSGSTSKASASDISIQSSGNITLDGKSYVASQADGGGESGLISIAARNIVIGTDATVSSSSAIVGAGAATSGAGSLKLQASESLLLNGNITSKNGDGTPGSITITVPNLTIETNVNTKGISSSTVGTGAAGDIGITANRVDMNKSSISSKSEIYSTGKAGSIDMKIADRLRLVDSNINTSSVANADGGSITIDPIFVNLKNSSITTSVKGGTGNGGNIKLTSNQLLLDNSRIVAQADAGNGGSINLNSGIIIQSPIGSLISASSNLGLQGLVVLSSPIFDANALVEMPTALKDATALTPRRCITTGDDISSFVVYGCGSLSKHPDAAVIGK